MTLQNTMSLNILTHTQRHCTWTKWAGPQEKSMNDLVNNAIFQVIKHDSKTNKGTKTCPEYNEMMNIVKMKIEK